jgi:hypothetical protein
MAGHGEKQLRKWEQAVAALLAEPTVEEAARKAKVAYSTLKGWLRQPAFREEYRAARGLVLERAVSRLLAVSVKAVQALEKNLKAKDAGVSTRAAVAVLQLAVKGHEALDLAEQLAELKAKVKELESGHGNVATGGAQAPGPGGHADRRGPHTAAGPAAG